MKFFSLKWNRGQPVSQKDHCRLDLVGLGSMHATKTRLRYGHLTGFESVSALHYPSTSPGMVSSCGLLSRIWLCLLSSNILCNLFKKKSQLTKDKRPHWPKHVYTKEEHFLQLFHLREKYMEQWTSWADKKCYINKPRQPLKKKKKSAEEVKKINISDIVEIVLEEKS